MIGVSMIFAVCIAGCGGQATAAAELPPTVGPTAEPTVAPERLAAARQLLISQGCIGCHTIESVPEAIGQIGPNLSHIASEAPGLIASQGYKDSGGTATSVREYLRESILKPSQFLVPACPTGACPDYVMPRDFKTRMTAEEIEILLDLFATLK